MEREISHSVERREEGERGEGGREEKGREGRDGRKKGGRGTVGVKYKLCAMSGSYEGIKDSEKIFVH